MNKLFRSQTLLQVLRNNQDAHRSPAIEFETREIKDKKYAYNQYYVYPEDYRPWKSNYKGNGFFYAMALLGVYINYQYEKNYEIMRGGPRRDKIYYKN